MIDKKTADLVWTWGEDILGHQHDVQMIDPGLPGEGNVLIMDNGFGSKFLDTAVSTVFEVDPKTNKIVWYFYGVDPRRGSFRSWHLSGCQRLPNGNTLITEGETGRIFEVTPEKEIVWEYINPTNNDIFKARKVPPSWVPEIKLTPNLAEAAKLMAEAQAYYSAARKMVDQANKFLEYEIVK